MYKMYRLKLNDSEILVFLLGHDSCTVLPDDDEKTYLDFLLIICVPQDHKNHVNCQVVFNQ